MGLALRRGEPAAAAILGQHHRWREAWSSPGPCLRRTSAARINAAQGRLLAGVLTCVGASNCRISYPLDAVLLLKATNLIRRKTRGAPARTRLDAFVRGYLRSAPTAVGAGEHRPAHRGCLAAFALA